MSILCPFHFSALLASRPLQIVLEIRIKGSLLSLLPFSDIITGLSETLCCLSGQVKHAGWLLTLTSPLVLQGHRVSRCYVPVCPALGCALAGQPLTRADSNKGKGRPVVVLPKPFQGLSSMPRDYLPFKLYGNDRKL